MAAAQEQSTVTDKRVTFQNANHETLVGLLRDCGHQAAILCHGWKSTKEQSMFAQLANRLEAEGLTTLRFDFSGNGESEGGFHYGNYKAEVNHKCCSFLSEPECTWVPARRESEVLYAAAPTVPWPPCKASDVSAWQKRDCICRVTEQSSGVECCSCYGPACLQRKAGDVCNALHRLHCQQCHCAVRARGPLTTAVKKHRRDSSVPGGTAS